MDYPIVIIEKTGADIISVLGDYQKEFGFYMTSEKMNQLKESFVSQREDSGLGKVRARVVIIESLNDKDEVIRSVEASGMRFATSLELLLFAQQCNTPKVYIQKDEDLEIYTLVRKSEFVPRLICPALTEIGFIYQGLSYFDENLCERSLPIYGDRLIPSYLPRFKSIYNNKKAQFLTVLLG